MTEQSEANEDVWCVRTRNIVFVFLTHIKDDCGQKKTQEVCWCFREKWKMGWAVGIWIVSGATKWWTALYCFPLCAGDWFGNCTHTYTFTHTCHPSVFLFLADIKLRHTFRFTSSSLIIGIFYRFKRPLAEGIQTTTIQLGEPGGSPKK